MLCLALTQFTMFRPTPPPPYPPHTHTRLVKTIEDGPKANTETYIVVSVDLI